MSVNEVENFMEVMVNRRNWIDFLKAPERKKAIMRLDAGNEQRCCLGHACHVLGEEMFELNIGYSYGDILNNSHAPESVMKALGLKTRVGGFGDDTSYAVHRDDTTNVLTWEINNRGVTFAGTVDTTVLRYVDSLASLNDDHVLNVTPQEIGAYLETVINGGAGTPFYNNEEWMKYYG